MISKFRGDDIGAKLCAESALSFQRARKQKSSSDIGICLLDLGLATLACGNWASAIEVLIEAQYIFEHIPEKDYLVGKCKMNIGLAILKSGDAKKARDYLADALSILRCPSGKIHEDVGLCAMNLAGATLQCGELVTAKKQFEDALSILTMGECNHNIGGCLMNLAYVMLRCGDFKEAKKKLESALSILRDTLGKEHPDVTQCLEYLKEASRSLNNTSPEVTLERWHIRKSTSSSDELRVDLQRDNSIEENEEEIMEASQLSGSL